jgi:hypothetical protein
MKRAPLEKLMAYGRAEGKASAHRVQGDLRYLVPGSASLSLFDRLLWLELGDHITCLLPRTPGVFVGGRKHAQPKDIGLALGVMLGPSVHQDIFWRSAHEVYFAVAAG